MSPISITCSLVVYIVMMRTFKTSDHLSDLDFSYTEPKTEKGYIALGMSKRMSKRISFIELSNERWVREKFSTNEEIHKPNPIPRILLDIPRDMYPFSVFGSEQKTIP